MLNVEKAIWIDNDGYWYFSSGQAYIDYPVRFPTVTIALSDTTALCKLADEIREEAGFLPMFPDDESKEYDSSGWYNFYICLNGFSDTMVSNSIEAVVQSEFAEDNEQSYDIPLTEAEQIAVYNEVDKQLKERFYTSCEELLEESRQEMIEYEEWKAKNKEVFDEIVSAV